MKFVFSFLQVARLAPAWVRSPAMCEKCDEIDGLIARYRALQKRILDQAFIELARELIAEKEAEKAAIHPG